MVPMTIPITNGLVLMVHAAKESPLDDYSYFYTNLHELRKVDAESALEHALKASHVPLRALAAALLASGPPALRLGPALGPLQPMQHPTWPHNRC